MACLFSKEPIKEEQERLLGVFENYPPEQDLFALVEYFREVTARQEGIWANELPGGSEEDHPYMFGDFDQMFPKEVWDSDAIVRRCTAIRAAEFLDSLKYIAPDLGWIVFIRIILSSVTDEEKVIFDLSEHVTEILGRECSSSDLSQFGANYLKESLEELKGHAKLMGRMYALLADSGSHLSRNYFAGQALGILSLLDSQKGTAQERGRYLEDLVEALIRMEPKLPILQKNLANDTEELDLVLSNQLDNPFWISMQSPVIFVECKNWKSPVGASEARVFESKLRERGNICRVGIFVALNGFTAPFTEVVKRIQSQGHIIFVVTGDDIRDMLDNKMSLPEWLIERGTVRII